ncbi:MAG TPA: isochorismatase family protein [Planctomycetaceae bacterium]|jgi:nicotinamidase-related amidase|nr:isochorismatase family protein [Planctomycetaceae bacterium]
MFPKRQGIAVFTAAIEIVLWVSLLTGGLEVGFRWAIGLFTPAASQVETNVAFASGSGQQAESRGRRVYQNRLTPIANAPPLLADYPEFVQPVIEKTRFEAPVLVDEPGADLSVRAWRFSYNARGIIEMPNRIRADHTAVIMVHPWGIDDGQGWQSPEPAGVCDFCTPDKNHLAGRHTRTVIDPLLKRLRGHVAQVLFSLRGHEYPVQAKIYRSIRHTPTPAERAQGHWELTEVLNRFHYKGEPLPSDITLSDDHPVRDYFQQFPGLDAGARYNNAGFWDLPIPVTKDVEVFPNDVVYYDEDGYPLLRDFLKRLGVRHVLLTGYATDMCYCKTTAGYENLSKDFNVFLVGDATLATFPANDTPSHATNAHISFASLNQLITQCSWIRFEGGAQARR